MKAREEAAEAARILLSLGCRALRRPPEWAPRPTMEAEPAALPVSASKGWSQRRRRSPRQGWCQAKSKAWAAPWCAPDGLEPSPLEPVNSGAGSSGEDVGLPRRRMRWEPEVKAGLYFGAAAGSVPKASGLDGARSQSQKAAAATPAALKEDMKALSPETPLHFAAAAAGSGASSSGDDGARSPEKRKAPSAGGSRAASSGDEGCSSPSKRTRTAAAAAGYGVRQAPAAAVQVKELEVQPEKHQNRDQNGVLLFDLNEAVPVEWEQD